MTYNAAPVKIYSIYRETVINTEEKQAYNLFMIEQCEQLCSSHVTDFVHCLYMFQVEWFT
jgi:hypothetical protein